MEKNYSFKQRAFVALCLFFVYNFSHGQTATVFTDDFTTPNAANYSIANGPLSGSLIWNMNRSGANFGAAIANGRIQLTNTGSSAFNSSGWILASTATTGFASPFNPILANNPGPVTWSFNLRQTRTNPSGFASNSSYGTAFILAGTAGTTNVTGTGYAITLGNTGSVDPIRLVRYTSGIRTSSLILASSTTGLTDFGTQYLSIRVVYTPSTNTWQLFVRNDGTTAFANPNSGTLVAQGSAVNNNYTNTSLPLMGGYLNAGTASNQTAFFDNVSVTVGVPFITSIAPNSKIAGTGAFQIIVTGQNFFPTSLVQWNGATRPTTYNSPTQLTVNIPASDIVTSGTALVTVANGTTVSNSNVFTIDPAGVPTLTTSTAFVNLATNVTGTASTASTYTITGANLTADPVTITAPANLELSRDNATYANSLTLTRSGNTLTGQPVIIYVRTRGATAPGIYSSVITNTAPGAVTKNVTVNATVFAASPTVAATGLSFTGITSTSFTANWTNGNGARRLVLIRPANAVNAFPVNGQAYNAVAQFGLGSEIGTGNFVVYSGTGSSATITGLSPLTIYHIAVIEYNGTGGIENYATARLNGNTTTLATPVGWQIFTQNTVNTITFDTTVDGVNNDGFLGDGLSPTPEVGQLNSGAWAFTGFSDGPLAFGGTSAEDSDYDQGISSGGTSDSGLYAFETKPDNVALGIQPGTGDFAPGTVTLKVQNRTTQPINSISVGYKVYIYNDQPSSSSFNFSTSPDGTTYTTLPVLNITSPTVADETPQWKGYYRVATIPITVAVNSHIYLRWSSATAPGPVDFDEFALDDISIVVSNAASPTVFAPFNDTAETFVLNGNATLSGNLNVIGNISFNNNARLIVGANTLTLDGTITNATLQGIRGGTSSNLIVGGTTAKTLSLDQTTVGTTNLFNNLSIATTGIITTTVANPLAVNGSLNVATDQILNMGANVLTGNLTTPVINGTLQTANITTTPLPVGKNWSGTGTVHYNASPTAQRVVQGTYNNLTVSSTGGALAGGALSVNGILDLPSNNPNATTGSLSMNGFELLMGANATNTGIGDVTGDVIRNTILSNVLYTYGHPHTSIIFPAIGTLPTSLGLRIQIGAAPVWRAGAIQRIYDLKQTGAANTKAIIKAYYKDGELNGNNEEALVDWARIIATSTTLEQGRSNYNTVENWVELTNVNVGLYFQANFGAVELTLDEYEATSLTWNGSIDSNWITAGNWTPSGVPSNLTTIYIPDAATTPNDPLLNNASNARQVNILTGGILNAPATASQFTVHGGAGAWINNGNFVATASSTVTFNNIDATIAGETNFNNLTIATGAGLRPLTGSIMRISGVLNRVGIFSPGAVENTVEFTGTNQTIPQLTTGLAAYNTLIISGSGAILPTPLSITGNFILNNTVNFAGNTVVMKGTSLQTISGTTSPAFNNLAIENGGVALAVNAAINGTLTLTSGQLIVDSNILTLANPVAGAPFNVTKMIATGPSGEVRKSFSAIGSYTFPIGENITPDYSPITVNVTAGTFASAYVGVSVTDGIHPNNASTQNNISRYWTVKQAGITGAVATINATFIPADASADVTTIAAAQLTGAFNQATNPWVKYGPLSGTTLTATGVTLTAGQPNIFTGIRGDNFEVVISGFGEFCEDLPVTLTATTSGGDGPYTYAWSPDLGTQATATPPTTTAGSITYTVVVKDANGIVADDEAIVTVLTESLGGTLIPSQNVCVKALPSTITLTGYTGDILYWQRAENPAFPSLTTINISNTTDILTGETAGPILTTTYFRAVVSNGNCGEVFSGITSAIIESTTWNGAWSNGAPNSSTNVIINSNYTANTNLEACTVTIENNADVTVLSGVSLTLNGALIIDSGSIIFEDDASLVQTDDIIQNDGVAFTMKRITDPMYRYDFTYWSSPVENQTLLNLSPTTLFDKYYGWIPTSQSWHIYYGGNHTMQAGAGYAVRAPQDFSVNPLTVLPYEGILTGKPHNGVVRTAITGNEGYNLLGNPYPSAIDANVFLSDPINSSLDGTLYFWTHNTPPESSGGPFYSYSADDYAMYNLLGPVGTAAVSETTPTPANTPNGFIASGQGFFVKGLSDGYAHFNNSMRVAGNNNQFFRSASNIEKHRIWLNMSNTNGNFKQLLVGYTTNGTNDFERGWDGALMRSNALNFYSFIEDDYFSIQSFGLPFSNSHVVALGFSTNFEGNHSISLNESDGLFTEQDIYLHDKALDIVHDLKLSNYEFATESGTFNDRFEIVYVNADLENPDHQIKNGILIYKNEQIVTVKSAMEEISSVKIIDMQGRILYTLEEVNSNQATINLELPNQVYIVSVIDKKGNRYNKKFIH